MYNSGNSGPGRPSDNGTGSKFQNKNISGSFKAPTGPTSRSSSGLTVMRGNKGVGKPIGGAAAPTASAPMPLNTPSAKRENNGRDPSINLVPSNRTAPVWGQSEEQSAESRAPPQPAPVVSKPAPWAKPENTDATNKPAPVLRPHTTNWADVDVDSDEDDSPPLSAGGHGSSLTTNTGGSALRQNAPGNAQFSHQQGMQSSGYDLNLNHRKDRTGSFGDSYGPGNDQRRMGGGFGSSGYGGHLHDDVRTGSGHRAGSYGSGDARVSGQSQVDFGRNVFGGGSYGTSPNFSGMRGPAQGGGGGFSSRSGAGSDRSFGHMPPPAHQGFSRHGGGGGGPVNNTNNNSFGQSSSIFGQNGYYNSSGHSGDGLTEEQRAIETARYEFELLEAKKLRKRTMSSEEGGIASAAAAVNSGAHGPQSHNNSNAGRQHEFDGGHGGDSRGSYFRGNELSSGANFGYNNNNPRSNNNNSYQRGHDESYGNSQQQQQGMGGMGGVNGRGAHAFGTSSDSLNRVPHRTRGPDIQISDMNTAQHFQHHQSQSAQRGDSGGLRAGFGYDLAAGSVASSESTWERVKRPAMEPAGMMHSRQQQGPSNLPASNPFVPPDLAGGQGNTSDRWRQQPLPTPPPLHMNAHFMNMSHNGHGAVQVVPRERGPRTPRDSELATQTTILQPGGKAGDDHRCSTSPSVDPNRTFSSLFSRAGVEPSRGGLQSSEGPSSLRDPYSAPQHQNQQAHGNYIDAQEAAFRQFAQNNNNPHQQQQYDVNHRAPQSTPPGAGSNRPKMLFDPQSNAFRELAGAEKVPIKKQDVTRRSTGPPAHQDNEEHAQRTTSSTTVSAVSRKVMQVNRIEQNPGDKWNRQALPKETSVRQEVHHVNVDDHEHEDEKSVRQDQHEARKEARNKERAERGPRTKGFLFHYTEDGQIERVFTPEEKVRADALKARKAEKAEKERRIAGVQENPLAVSSIDNLPLRLSQEQYNALTTEQKQELKAKQQELRAARDAHKETSPTNTITADAAVSDVVANLPLKLSSEDYRALTKEQQQELKLRQQKERDERKAIKREGKRSKGSATADTTPITSSTTSVPKRSMSSSRDHPAAVATAAAAGAATSTAVSGVQPHLQQSVDRHEQQQLLSSLNNDASSNWQEMASASQWDQSILSERVPDYPQPRHNMPSSASHYSEQPSGNWARERIYGGYTGAPEPALFGGNTSFLVGAEPETSLGSRFAALSARHDREEYDDYDDNERAGLAPSSGGGRGSRGGREGRDGWGDGRGEGYGRERENSRGGGRSGGRGSGRAAGGGKGRVGPPALEASSHSHSVRADHDREDGVSAGRGRGRGRGSGGRARGDAGEEHSGRGGPGGRGRGKPRPASSE
mmetsp:Transcript_66158/g.130177  ORF Transcript_66158/g.130177 Transcript_66158/m.130177 type:complete len:1366 (+) Transcript_66158:131-4228(+)